MVYSLLTLWLGKQSKSSSNGFKTNYFSSTYKREKSALIELLFAVKRAKTFVQCINLVVFLVRKMWQTIVIDWFASTYISRTWVQSFMSSEFLKQIFSKSKIFFNLFLFGSIRWEMFMTKITVWNHLTCKLKVTFSILFVPAKQSSYENRNRSFTNTHAKNPTNWTPLKHFCLILVYHLL